ncbi:type IV toxin-antitoxin system AbiEi family antitoxin domain-containing protein [Lacunimicrobium album]
MAGRTRLSIAKKDIESEFDQQGRTIISQRDIAKILRANRDFWRLTEATTVRMFVEFLVKSSKLRRHLFPFPHRKVILFSWGDVTRWEVLNNLHSDAYFSHLTAANLHGLTLQAPNSVYLNVEQSNSGIGAELSQEAIDRAYSGSCRTTSNFVTYEDLTIYWLNGKNTDRLGVKEFQHGDLRLNVTDLERTLIDLAVRPIYSGGVFEVAEAFSNAADRVSVNRIASYLRRMNYGYPFHQCIGFYLERTKKLENFQLRMLKDFGFEFDFYLTHDMQDTVYVPEWRLFVPKGLQL